MTFSLYLMVIHVTDACHPYFDAYIDTSLFLHFLTLSSLHKVAYIGIFFGIADRINDTWQLSWILLKGSIPKSIQQGRGWWDAILTKGGNYTVEPCRFHLIMKVLFVKDHTSEKKNDFYLNTVYWYKLLHMGHSVWLSMYIKIHRH